MPYVLTCYAPSLSLKPGLSFEAGGIHEGRKESGVEGGLSRPWPSLVFPYFRWWRHVKFFSRLRSRRSTPPLPPSCNHGRERRKCAARVAVGGGIGSVTRREKVSGYCFRLNKRKTPPRSSSTLFCRNQGLASPADPSSPIIMPLKSLRSCLCYKMMCNYPLSGLRTGAVEEETRCARR